LTFFVHSLRNFTSGKVSGESHPSIMQIEVNFLNEKEKKEPGVLNAVLYINQISRREIVGDTFAKCDADVSLDGYVILCRFLETYLIPTQL